ncbi:MAG: hypothetical protein ACOYO1_00780 [Bacteroidales bacterium]
MNDIYILIETRNFENGRMCKQMTLNSSGEWNEKTFSTDITKKPETEVTAVSYKNVTIIEYQDKNYCHKFKYDAYGRVVNMKYYEDNKLTDYTEFKYNSPYSNTKCNQFKMFETPRKKKCLWEFNYNLEGKKIQELCFYPNGDIAWYGNYVYNKDKQITEVLTYNNENVLIYKKITFYNSIGDKIKKEKYVHKDHIHQWKSYSGEIGFYLWTSGA